MVDDDELLELVEMEVRELSGSTYEFPGDDTPISDWFSALKALEGEDSGDRCSRQSVHEAGRGRWTSTFRSLSVRWMEPFLMPIEDVFSISGRGTVVTGRIARGDRSRLAMRSRSSGSRTRRQDDVHGR